MKILYHHRIASKDGQFVHVAEIIQALRELGHDVVVISPSITEAASFSTDGGYVAWLKRNIPQFVYELLEFAYAAWVTTKLVFAIGCERPEFIYERYNLFLPAGVWASRLHGIPLILEVNAPLYDERGRYDGLSLNRLARWSERYCWQNADAVLPVTSVLAERIAAEGVENERIHVIPNGINVEDYRDLPDRRETKDRLGIEASIVLGFTGYVRDWHGLDRVVRLIAARPEQEWHLLVVGDGPARAGIEKLAQELGISASVTFTGVVERGDIADLVSAFDVALQPDVVPYASPLKLFEYLAVGHAIVAPDSPNIREVLTHDENALLFDPSSESDFAETIVRVCLDDTLRNRLQIKARQLIDEKGYTWKKNAERIITIAGYAVLRAAD